MNETNWATQKPKNTLVTDSDRRNLEKAHRYEKELIRRGYRWHTVNNRTKVLIECDSKGRPTKEGLKQLERAKERLNS